MCVCVLAGTGATGYDSAYMVQKVMTCPELTVCGKILCAERALCVWRGFVTRLINSSVRTRCLCCKSDVFSLEAYSLRLIRISHVNIWRHVANCKIIEINVSNLLRIHRNHDLDLEMSVTYDSEPFQHHTMNIWNEIIRITFPNNAYDWDDFRTPIFRKYTAWYTFRILYL